MKLITTLLTLFSAVLASRLVGDYRPNFTLNVQAPERQQIGLLLADFLVDQCINQKIHGEGNYRTPSGGILWITSYWFNTAFDHGSFAEYKLEGTFGYEGAQNAFKFHAYFDNIQKNFHMRGQAKAQQYTLTTGQLDF